MQPDTLSFQLFLFSSNSGNNVKMKNYEKILNLVNYSHLKKSLARCSGHFKVDIHSSVLLSYSLPSLEFREHEQKTFVTLSAFWPLKRGDGAGGLEEGLRESIRKEKLWWKSLSYKGLYLTSFYKMYIQNFKYNIKGACIFLLILVDTL